VVLDDEDGKKAWIPFIIGGLGIGLLLWKTATGLYLAGQETLSRHTPRPVPARGHGQGTATLVPKMGTC
jgi:hypothetical protein